MQGLPYTFAFMDRESDEMIGTAKISSVVSWDRRDAWNGLRAKAAVAFLAWCVFGFSLPLSAFPQETAVASGHEKIRRQLLVIAKQTNLLEKELHQLEERKPTPSVNEKILALHSQIEKFNNDFHSLSTRIPLDIIQSSKELEIDWFKELEELTLPFLEVIRTLTEKPRKIDMLKKKIVRLKIKKQLYEEASRHVGELIEEETDNPVGQDPAGREMLSKLIFLKGKYDPELITFYLGEARAELEATLSVKEESWIDSATFFVKDFFKNRGRNLLVTAATFTGLWWFFMSVRKWLVGRQSKVKWSPFVRKILRAAYNSLVFLICLAASLICLYLFNDWLLISLVILGLLVTAWTSRRWGPRFVQEVRFILNLGTVREGERLIWKGVPWLVKDIGLYATLVNQQLEGGRIILPLMELVGQHSRPVVDNEPWFPSRLGDWVFLADGVYGQVANQTIEQVILQLKGGSLKYYSTSGFLDNTPKNISSGFRYTLEFGLDYGIQSRICDEIPQMFETGLRKHLDHYFAGESPDFRSLAVMFDNAGASSLNLKIDIDVEGRRADRYFPIQREIQTALVRICNENGLTIPFTQLTVSLSENLMKMADAAVPPSAKTSNDV